MSIKKRISVILTVLVDFPLKNVTLELFHLQKFILQKKEQVADHRSASKRVPSRYLLAQSQQ